MPTYLIYKLINPSIIFNSQCSVSHCINSNRRRSQSLTRGPSAGSGAREPFFLHPPGAPPSVHAAPNGGGGGSSVGGGGNPAHAPSDGLYVNPMRTPTHNTASSGEESSGEINILIYVLFHSQTLMRTSFFAYAFILLYY